VRSGSGSNRCGSWDSGARWRNANAGQVQASSLLGLPHHVRFFQRTGDLDEQVLRPEIALAYRLAEA
jgi:hypothetical protein